MTHIRWYSVYLSYLLRLKPSTCKTYTLKKMDCKDNEFVKMIMHLLMYDRIKRDSTGQRRLSKCICFYKERTAKSLHWPRLELGSPAWQASILPLDHQCFLYYNILFTMSFYYVVARKQQ